MTNSSYSRDLEVSAISDQFRVLIRKTSDLVDDIDATILLFTEFHTKQQTFGKETERDVKSHD